MFRVALFISSSCFNGIETTLQTEFLNCCTYYSGIKGFFWKFKKKTRKKYHHAAGKDNEDTFFSSINL